MAAARRLGVVARPRHGAALSAARWARRASNTGGGAGKDCGAQRKAVAALAPRKFFGRDRRSYASARMAQHHDLVSEIDVRQCWALNENKEEQSTLGNCLTAGLRMPRTGVDT
eukprot:scaffold121301_cov63-Phaeocystis_antarctica.AAC.3